jgi:outer membrane biosynthesis protein TonB
MSSIRNQDDTLLRTQVSQANENLSGLEQNLRAIDGKLENLATRREQYAALEQVCGSLEKLEELGAPELFWGSSQEGQTTDHVRKVRALAAEFEEQLGEIRNNREAVLGEVNQGQEILDILEDDLCELELEEEERLNEWIPEREESALPDRPMVMPWSRESESDKRFRKSLSGTLLSALLLGALIPWIDLPLPDLMEIPEIPERYANLIRQAELPPPPAPVIEEPPPVDEIPEPIVAEETPPEVPEVPTVAEASEPQADPVPAPAEAAPELQVRSAGILAFSQSFSNLVGDGPTARLGSEALINDAGESAVGRTERSMVTTQEPGSSGGINLASLSRNVAGGGDGQQLDGVEAGRVASSIGGSGTSDRPLSGGVSAGRTDEEIQIVFDRYKASLYRVYNRELRNDPTLRGQVVLQLTIESDGSVSYCVVQSSDLGAPALEQQVAERVRTFDFGAKSDVPPITILYPIDFLPAA